LRIWARGFIRSNPTDTAPKDDSNPRHRGYGFVLAVVQSKLTHERRRIVWKLALTLGLYLLVAYAFELYLLLRPPSAILGVEIILGAIGGGAVFFIISGIIPTIVWAFSKFRLAKVGLPLILWAALGILVGLLAWLGSPGGVFGGR
jgi:hypothetical protein